MASPPASSGAPPWQPPRKPAAIRRWKLARERLIVDKKGSSKLIEVHLKKYAHNDRFGITARVRPQANGHPGLVIWEECTSGIMGGHNKNAKPHMKVKKFSIILAVNGKSLNAEMLSEIHAMDEIMLKIRVPQGTGPGMAGAAKHFEEMMGIALPLSRVKGRLQASADNGTSTGAPAASSTPAGAASSAAEGGDASANAESNEDPELQAKLKEQQGEQMGELVKKTLVAEIEADHRFAASTDNDAETGASIESFLSDPQAFCIMQQMLMEEGANSSGTMRKFMDEVSSYHIGQAKAKAHGFFSGLGSCACDRRTAKNGE